MDELLKDNAKPSESPNISKRIGEILDKKIEQAMQRFNEEVSKVNKPIEDTNDVSENDLNENTKEVTNNEESTGEQEGEQENE